MTANKVKEMIDKLAANKLIPPAACVITYSQIDGLEMWWRADYRGSNIDILSSLMLAELQLVAGQWRARRSACMLSITKDAHYDREFALTYNDFIAFTQEKELKIAPVVADVIAKAKGLKWEDHPLRQSNQPEYEITTQYNVDSLTFDTKDAAERHVKIVKMFDQFQKAGVVEYEPVKDLIESMIDNPEKYIKILQGK